MLLNRKDIDINLKNKFNVTSLEAAKHCGYTGKEELLKAHETL